LDEAPGLALADDSGNDLSWSQVANQTNRMAHALRDIGFHDGSRLAVLGQNSVDVMLVYVAAKLAGIGAILVNYHLTVDEVEYVLGDGNAGAVWTSAECIATALEAAERLGIPVLNDVERSGRWRVAMAEAASGALSDELPASTDLIYTSGTTGSPKGVEFPAGPTPTLSDQLQLAARHHMAGLGPHLVVGPLYHAGPHTAVGLLLSGTPVVVTRRFDADLILRVIEGRRIASSIMVPTHFVRLLRLPERRRQAADVSSLRLVSVTGSHCPPQVKHSMIEWFGPVLLETYGASESGIITRITSEEWLSRPGSVGRPVAPFQIIVLDQEGGQCPPGRDGTLYFVDETKRGIRYHNDRKKTAAAHIVPGTFTLGDLGHLDEDGYLYVTGRSTDLVISGGVNIYPAECEHVLVQHPSVDDVALFGVPDPEMGERLVGLVVLRNDGSTAEELREFCRGALAGYKTPRDLVFVNEIPRTAMGKLDKRTLPEIYLGITRANQRDEANR
jgi:long-chain acyl-CoA synthetase